MLWIIVVVVLVAAFAAYAASRPPTFTVRREIGVAATPEAIYPLIADFHRWSQWSPYDKRDPNMTRTYSGAPSGVGAAYDWSGNGKVGAGRMEITDAAAPSRVVLDLHMLKPVEARNVVTFTIEPQGAGTRVVWAMQGASSFLHRAMGLVINMDKLVGTDFERGLVALKSAVED